MTICAAIITLASRALADGISDLTLASSGSITDFTITGTYLPGIAVTSFSSPNTAYSPTFALPASRSPASFAFLDVPDRLFGIDTAVMVNGVSFANSRTVFFVGAQGGGLVVLPEFGMQSD